MGNSQLRPETVTAREGTYCPKGGTAYQMVYNAVRDQKGLIHGRLHYAGAHCAIGSLFHNEDSIALETSFIDEVAAVNDSCRSATPHQRKLRVMRWLRWKLKAYGITRP